MAESDVDYSFFKNLLLEKQKRLLEVSGIGNDAASVVELDQTRVGRVSRMDAMRAQAMSADAKRRRELELTRISRALKRIDANEYGDCIACGDAISGERLKVEPSNPLCINCAD